MWAVVKTRCFHSLLLIHDENFEIKIKTIKIQHTIFETFTKKSSLWNLSVFHDGPFELEVLEIFTTAFLFKTLIWTWIFFQVLQSALLKNQRKTDRRTEARERRKILKKEKEKQKMKKKNQTATTNIFYSYFFTWKNLYFIRKHIWKNLVYIVTFVHGTCISFFL